MAGKSILEPGYEWIVVVTILIALLVLAYVIVFVVIPSIPP